VSALIVSATFGAGTQAALDRMRAQWFPPERNQLAAHLTLFHALPADALAEVTAALERVCARPAPAAEVSGVRSLGRGTALVVASPGLVRAREEVAAGFAGRLTRQAELSAGFVPWALDVTGLAVHRYLGGPWELLAEVGFDAGGA
jgi:hypothetical protein